MCVTRVACMYMRIADVAPKVETTQKVGTFVTFCSKATRLTLTLKTYVQIQPRRLVFPPFFLSFFKNKYMHDHFLGGDSVRTFFFVSASVCLSMRFSELEFSVK